MSLPAYIQPFPRARALQSALFLGHCILTSDALGQNWRYVSGMEFSEQSESVPVARQPFFILGGMGGILINNGWLCG